MLQEGIFSMEDQTVTSSWDSAHLVVGSLTNQWQENIWKLEAGLESPSWEQYLNGNVENDPAKVKENDVSSYENKTTDLFNQSSVAMSPVSIPPQSPVALAESCSSYSDKSEAETILDELFKSSENQQTAAPIPTDELETFFNDIFADNDGSLSHDTQSRTLTINEGEKLNLSSFAEESSCDWGSTERLAFSQSNSNLSEIKTSKRKADEIDVRVENQPKLKKQAVSREHKKKEQNKLAAQRYRDKKKNEADTIGSEAKKLEGIQKKLINEYNDIVKERNIILKLFWEASERNSKLKIHFPQHIIEKFTK